MSTVDDVRRVAETKHEFIVKVVLSWHVPAGSKVVHARFWSLRRHVKPEGRQEHRERVSVNPVRIAQQHHVAIVCALIDNF